MEAALFDMDGVLVDSVSHKRDVWRRVLRDELGVDVPVNDIVGLNLDDKYAYLERQTTLGIGKAVFVERMGEGTDELYAERVNLLGCFESVSDRLRAEGARIGVVTAGTDHHLRTVLERFELRDAVDYAVSADAIDGPSKPEPDLYLAAASALGVDPENCVAVEDSANGVRAATRAGAYCIGYRPPENPEQDLSRADETVADSDALEARLLALVAAE